MGRIKLDEKDYPQALAYFKKIIEKDKKNRFGWLYTGFTYTDMDSLKSTEATYKAALQELPEDASIWAFYGVSLQRQEKYQQAIEAFKKALELEPYNINAVTSLPLIYETLEMYEQCDSVYEAAVNRFPDNALLLNNFSYSLAERNIRLKEALEMAKKAVKAKPDNAAYLDTIGWIYFKLKNVEQAEEYIKKQVKPARNSV